MQTQGDSGNVILLRGACLWIIAALILAWCMVAIGFSVPPFAAIFPGKFTRILQAHIDFLLMSALILGFYAARVPLPRPVRWAMVGGAFTNSSLFLLMALFPSLEPDSGAKGPHVVLFLTYEMASLLMTSFGFGRACVVVFKSTFRKAEA